MSKKKLVKQNDEFRVVKRPRVQALLGLGSVALTATMVSFGVGAAVKASNKLYNLESDFINNNMEYREYIARKNAEVDYNYNNGSGDMTFQEWMNEKSDVNSMNNVEDAINLFADDDVKKEYFDKKKSATDLTILSCIESAANIISIAVTTSDIVNNGFTEEKIKYKKEKDEEEMTI